MPRSRRAANQARTRFFQALAAERSYHPLLENLPGLAFFAKDCDFRLVSANRHFYERFGFHSEAEIIGRNDFDLFPPQLAEHFRTDDSEVIQTIQPKLNIIELFFDRAGLPDWFITHKFPALDARGRCIGLLGITQTYAQARQSLQHYGAIDRAIECIRNRFRERLTVTQLAADVHLSPRQLHRRFVETFGTSPQAFLLKVRVQAACELLQHGDRSIAEVARESGFGDQSSFTQHFRRAIGTTPRDYQKRYRLILK